MKYYKICVIGNARAQQKNPITLRYSRFFMTFVADFESGKIFDVESSVMLSLTDKFIKDIFMGRSLAEVDREALAQVELTYAGSSKKAIQMAYVDAVRRFNKHKSDLENGTAARRSF